MALDYLPIVFMLLLAFSFPGLTLGLSALLSPRRPDPVKDGVYECGVDPEGDARLRHSVRFYVVAMLFIVFDLETVFLYPWAVVFRKLGLFGLWEMLVFLGILILGLVYVWKRGALDWSAQMESIRERRVIPRPPGSLAPPAARGAQSALDAAFEWGDALERRR